MTRAGSEFCILILRKKTVYNMKNNPCIVLALVEMYPDSLNGN